MKLLLKRSQTRGRFRMVIFKLWGKVELEGDEQKIIDRYDIDQAVLIFSDQPNLKRQSSSVRCTTGNRRICSTGMNYRWKITNYRWKIRLLKS